MQLKQYPGGNLYLRMHILEKNKDGEVNDLNFNLKKLETAEQLKSKKEKGRK